jgi:pSer/pThr/pTyr-binding forkhead associated (FHA) protein
LQASIKPGKGKTTIGRDQGCKFQIPDDRMSRMHAMIQPENGGHEIENLGTNGTRVNGLSLHNRKLLRPGDVIQICDYILTYRTDVAPVVNIAGTLQE